MKYKIKSKFHNTEMTITVKNAIKPIQGDILTALEYEAYDRDHKHHDYAIRKLKAIKAKLCGARFTSCQCPFEMEKNDYYMQES